MAQSIIGIHGKMPSHGDFIKQNLPGSFVDVWDHWLQQALLASQDALGSAWLETFLVSPVWRFAIPEGSIDKSAWAGILLPSVDRVGRYFPLTFCAQIPQNLGVFEFMSNAEAWFDQLEETAYSALDGLSMEEVMSSLEQSAFSLEGEPGQLVSLEAKANAQFSLSLTNPDDKLNSITPLLCDAMLKGQASKFSIWWTKGAQHVDPVVLLSEKLPRPNSYNAMLNGQWNLWHWPNLIQ